MTGASGQSLMAICSQSPAWKPPGREETGKGQGNSETQGERHTQSRKTDPWIGSGRAERERSGEEEEERRPGLLLIPQPDTRPQAMELLQ